MVLSKEHQQIQELLAHPGWAHFKALLLGPANPVRQDRGLKCLKDQLNDKLMAAARSGQTIDAAKFAGQIDILPVILALPEQELEKAQGKKEPVDLNGSGRFA